MIILDTVGKKLRVVLANPKTTKDCPITVHYVDAPTYTPDSLGIFSNGVTAVDILAGLGAPNTRHIKLFTFINTDTAIVRPTISYNDAGTIYPITADPLELAIGDTLQYADGEGWSVIDRFGNRKGIGTPGAAGIAGATGSAGVGIPGFDGKKGDFGFPGPPGIGIQGIQGVPGTPGSIGVDGKSILALDGKRGIEGFPGVKGDRGLTGLDGKSIPGLDGKQGPMGFPIPGKDGVPGIQGIPGVGIAGAQGFPGLDGKMGPMGFPIPGPKGDKGDTGATGGAGGGSAPAMLMTRDGNSGMMGFPGPPGPIDGIKISGLPAATDFSIADLIPGVEGGVTVQFTGQQIIDAIIKRGTGVTIAAGPFETWLALSAASGAITGVTLVTVMSITGVGVGTWYFKCYLVYQTTAVTTGIDVAANHTGTTTQWVNEIHYAATGQLAATAAATELANNAAGNIYEQAGGRTKGAAIGAGTVSVDTANADHVMEIEGFFTVTVSGTFQIQLAAEVAALVCSARIGSFLMLRKIV